MTPDEAWNSVLAQLQMEMPRSSFDTWVRDTHAISLVDEQMTIVARNTTTRDWLESRLTATVQRLLIGIVNQRVSVQFVVQDTNDAESEIMEDEEEDLRIEPMQWLDYDRIVQPHKQVVVKGYLRRLGMEIGAKAIWLYIGFHQAAWQVHMNGKESGMALHSREIIRFSGLSFGAFWRLLRHQETQSQLNGLVKRIDPLHQRSYRRGRDGRPHRLPVRYQVCMTPRLTRSDSAAVYSRLTALLDQGVTLITALRELLNITDVMELITPAESMSRDITIHTVMDMVRLQTPDEYDAQVNYLAQELHRKIINALGDIHITHYFITKVIDEHNLTPAQAWLVTVARDMAYFNSRTGERRDRVTFQKGYQEMASLIGSNRYKTVQAWFHPQWTTQQRGGDLSKFMVEVEPASSDSYLDLRVDSMPRAYRVLLDEPLDAIGNNTPDANGSNSQTQVEGMAAATGRNMLDANGTVLNSLTPAINTQGKNTTNPYTTVAVPAFWELKALLQQNNVHPKIQHELVQAQASVHAFVSWVLYVASPESGKLSDPLGYAISRLRADPIAEAEGIFRQLADLSPAQLLSLIDGSSTRIEHPLAPAWNRTMGFRNQLWQTVRVILFGKGACQ
jgi:hypothetical protein